MVTCVEARGDERGSNEYESKQPPNKAQPLIRGRQVPTMSRLVHPKRNTSAFEAVAELGHTAEGSEEL